MIQEKLVISDTNILLDLISVDMLEDFFSLPCDFSTTDFVISEIIQPAQNESPRPKGRGIRAFGSPSCIDFGSSAKI